MFTILRLYMACKMWKITALSWDISSCRLVEKFHFSAFPTYYSLYICWRAWNYKTQKIYLLRIQKKGHKNKHKKTWMKLDYLIFSAMHMRKRHLLCTSSHHNVPYENQLELIPWLKKIIWVIGVLRRTVVSDWRFSIELNKRSEPWNECPC